MKVVVSTTILIILFFIGSLLFSSYVNNSCEELLEPIEALTDAITLEDWAKTGDAYDKLQEIWNQNKGVWEYLLEHQDLDRVGLSLDKLSQYLAVQDKTLSLIELTELKFNISTIAKKESFSLVNLF
ncbi:DUF4363 family protein [Alkaliphilus crotonatoxidans]